MSVFRWVGLVAVIGSLVACADDDPPKVAPTSDSKSQLSDPGTMGQDIPAPMPPGPWDDENWKPPVVPHDDGELDSLGRGSCTYGYQKIYDPGRSQYIEVPILLCQ